MNKFVKKSSSSQSKPTASGIMSQPQFLADHDLNEQIIVGVARRSPNVEFRRVRDLGFEERNDAFRY